MGLHILRPPESENYIIRVWFVCMCACLFVCVPVISITQKQIAAESSNLAFFICIIGRCYLKLLIKFGLKL